ncbi:hypothetical protein KUCAC02_030077 [Chaenocephalus aceratus]|uniref:Uncharacterized protein n=1 Tax=Chaenocephalus aceratus TaxID=36190 RepID=A0ACB9XIP0_CHAAC|nr:hypothetical protein KUCAC02_030077 [Chaenocephalus aceratus]
MKVMRILSVETGPTEYMLSMIGFAVGLGNIWRFPYLTYKQGGGAFLIPYFLMLVLCVISLFFLENAIGQFCSQGPVNSWRAVPILQGVGLSVVLVTMFMSIYYNLIIVYSLYYMFVSFQFPLPWSNCLNLPDSNCSTTPIVYCNVSGVLVTNWTQENTTCPSSDTITVSMQSPSEQYWEDPAAWMKQCCSAHQRHQVIWQSGLFYSYVSPCVDLADQRSTGLEGCSNSDFVSLSIGMGGIVTLASYSNFHNNMFLDSVVVTLLNHATSVFAGFNIFSILGHMAHIYGKPVAAVVKEGFGLAFIVFPDTLAKLPSLVHLSFCYVHHSWPGLSVYMFRGAHHLPVGCFP